MTDRGDPDRLARLLALRASQEATIEAGCGVRDFTALSAEYRRTLAEIDELMPKEQTGDSIDEIAARRAARRASTTTTARRTKRSG